MLRRSFVILSIGMFLTAAALGQKPAPTLSPAKEVGKANARPSPTPAAKAEPFDLADVRTMASKCVTLDTEAGAIELEMYPEQAPESVRNFLNMAATGLLDTTAFTRVVPGFVIQGGDLYSREGKVTYEVGMRARKTVADEPNKILHQRGVISMARSDEPNSATTHFFILLSDAPTLDGKFAAFGRVTKGMDVVDAINKAPVQNEKPDKPVRIRKATVGACTATANQ